MLVPCSSSQAEPVAIAQESRLLGVPCFPCCLKQRSLTHAVLHHHEPAFVAFIALALKVAGGVHTLASATQVGRYSALIDVCMKTTGSHDGGRGRLAT